MKKFVFICLKWIYRAVLFHRQKKRVNKSTTLSLAFKYLKIRILTFQGVTIIEETGASLRSAVRTLPSNKGVLRIVNNAVAIVQHTHIIVLRFKLALQTRSMYEKKEMMCPLCYSRYGTGYPQRIPRDLDCRHTFCTGEKNTHACLFRIHIMTVKRRSFLKKL